MGGCPRSIRSTGVPPVSPDSERGTGVPPVDESHGRDAHNTALAEVERWAPKAQVIAIQNQRGPSQDTHRIGWVGVHGTRICGYRAIAAELATIGYVLRGSITKRWMTCGRVSCGCIDDPEARHGPCYSWTYKRGGKTVSVNLSPEQARLCGDWIKNNRRLERIVQRLRAPSRRNAQLEQIPIK